MYLEDDRIKVCLIVITNNALVLDDNLDARVKSSMGSEAIMFPPYSKEELFDILISRREEAFVPGGFDEDCVDWCAELISEKTGDARKALDLMRVSGEIANEKGHRVTIDCVNMAINLVEKEWIWEELKALPMRTAFILNIIALLSLKKDKVSTRELYDIYRRMKIPKKLWRVQGMSERRILDILVDALYLRPTAV